MEQRNEKQLITSYTADMDAIYGMIVGADALPIIAVNPIPSSGADYIHQQRSYIVSKGWQTIRFDYAFSSSYAYNSAYFNSDGIHPNAPYIGGLENLSKKERRTRMIKGDYKCSTMRTLACIAKFYWQKKKN